MWEAGQPPFVTVITAAYNGEKTLAIAIESVLAQTYTYYEYIIINHGSVDGTKKIIEDYAQKDKRVKLLDLPVNFGGPAGALNIAMKEALGEYMCFLDADDAYKPDFIKNMIEAALRYDTDVAVCSFEEHNTGAPWQSGFIHDNHRLVRFAEEWRFLCIEDYREKFETFLTAFKYGFISLDVWWNKLYRSEFLRENDLLFPTNSLYFADMLLNFRIMSYFPRMVFLPFVGIRWTTSGKSTRDILSDKRIYETEMWVKEHIKFKRTLLENKICHSLVEYTLYVINAFAVSPRFSSLQQYDKTTFSSLCRYLHTDIPKELLRGENFLACCQANALFAVQLAFYFGIRASQATSSEHEWLYRLRTAAMLPENNLGIDETLKIIFAPNNCFSLGIELLFDCLTERKGVADNDEKYL